MYTLYSSFALSLGCSRSLPSDNLQLDLLQEVLEVQKNSTLRVESWLPSFVYSQHHSFSALNNMAPVHSAFFGSHVIQNALTIIPWAWLILDYHWRLRKEVKGIWRPVALGHRPSNIAIVYVFLRYGALIGQSVNMVWSIVLMSKPFVQPLVCSGWFWLQSLLIQGLFGAVQYVVMLRVDALYFGDWRSRILLIFSWLTERVALAYVGVETHRSLQTDATCMTAHLPVNLVIGLVAIMVSVQLVVWMMTFAKIYGGPKSPLTKLLSRDGALVCAAIVSLYLIVVPYASAVTVLSHNLFAFMITMLSNLGCALILNLQCLAFDEPSKPSHTGVTSTWCLDTLQASVDTDH
ncbi:hypothetical protein LshimejAT787_0905230 [Lyophyllum shimeji]|uniref:Uncharacterized protein n=1 Tax=Lyophyllum shimeji TaxID=47721 RepID=A0A9P3PSL9_LYOSH|nr:hypothetical protein LshimejAT787_0905230 [Lyophyllum shimeji]